MRLTRCMFVAVQMSMLMVEVCPTLADDPQLISIQQTIDRDLSTRDRMVARIDELLRRGWQEAGVEPAEVATDGEFLRRASLDLTGVIPRVSQVREFLADDQPDKRNRLVEQLLDSPRHATHMATVWRNRILPAGAEVMHPRESLGLQKWLRMRFADNLRYDSLVAGMLLATGEGELGPALYFQANDLAPEKLAASVSELFLGVKLQCAQCHDHPYSGFSQRDFWGLAAFFAQVRAPEQRGMNVSYRLYDENRGDVVLPDTDEVVPPKYPDGTPAVDQGLGSRRANLVLWLTSRDNRQFARAGVNWAWSHFFGHGLVDTIELGVDVEQSNNAKLLEELAEYFVKSGFDLRELLLTIASTQAYQLSSWQKVPADAETLLFAAMQPRPLSPEQLYDSSALLSPLIKSGGSAAVGQAAVDVVNLEDPLRQEFVRRMREPPGDATEYRAGTLQALMLMNGNVTAALTAPERSQVLGALEAPFMADGDRIDTLFLATLCRMPEEEERSTAFTLLDEAESKSDKQRVLSDLLWALFNSTEFAFNR